MVSMRKRAQPLLLFQPSILSSAKKRVMKTLSGRWIGQGPQVDEFETLWEERISHAHGAVAVNSGTSALHLSYILAGIKPGDEVIVPVFSCSATMTPLLYMGAKIVFADIQKETMNIDPQSVRGLMNEKVKAIVAVHYGGLPADLDELQKIATEWGIPLIEDAAQAHGARYKDKLIGEISDFTAFSFQAIKLITTGDGGMLTLKDTSLIEKAKRIRWFGIDRKAKFEDRWKKDITEVGYKYQMTDIAAAMGIEGLKNLSEIQWQYARLHEMYQWYLQDVPGVRIIKDKADRISSHWLMTIFVERRDDLKSKLAQYNIESDPTHYRCDKYSIFGGKVDYCKNMDDIEDMYLLLPCHPKVTEKDIKYICSVMKEGW